MVVLARGGGYLRRWGIFGVVVLARAGDIWGGGFSQCRGISGVVGAI